MVSEEQQKQILEKMSKILTAIKAYKSIPEVSEATGIPESTVQRYLNKQEYYVALAQNGILKTENLDKAIDYVSDWLKESKKAGLKKGGKISQEKYGFEKDDEGKFSGHSR